mgnify:CR=1 FL=1
MNVLIFGATGGIGKWAVRHALEKGHQVTAFVRNPSKLKMEHSSLRVIRGDIFDYPGVRAALTGQDAVIWCVGIPMKNKEICFESLHGHKILVHAMQDSGVTRLIDWGTPSIPFSEDRRSVLTVLPGILAGILFPRGKQEMIAIGKLLQASRLDWTLVRFLAPKDSPYTGSVKVSFGDTRIKFAISREDIAAFMVDQLESRQYIRSMPIIGS